MNTMNTETNTDNVETNNAPAGDAPAGGSESEEMKRHRTSPRTKAFDEALALIKTYIDGWGEEEEDESLKEALTTSFTHLQDKLIEIRDAGVVKPTYGGRHYVGINAEGARKQFQSNTTPTKTNAAGKTSVQVFGPFRSKEGAGWVVTNGPRETDRVVF